MEFIWKHKKTWSVLAILSTVIVILFTIFGGAAEEELAMKGKVVPKRIYLSFNMEYPIEKMYVQVGDEVHKGDVLGVLQMEDLKAQAEEKGLAKDVEFYLDFFKYGCPPHGGFGIGIDRLTMLFLGLSIKEAEFLFRGPNRLTP